MKTLKPQLESLENLTDHLYKIVISLKDAKKARIMPSFFEYISPSNIHTLEIQNQRLKKQVSQYEDTLYKVGAIIDKVIDTLENFKE